MTIFDFDQRGGVEDLDQAAYLTQRLRRLQPEPYELQIERTKKRAGRVGFALGSLVSLALVGAGIATLYFVPEALASLLAVID
ncbi:MAG: hypothetical protein K9G09_06040 [Pontimonas sp.]|nr:hypothetical protein [Pontimonas sp.]